MSKTEEQQKIELNEKMEMILKENNLDWQSVHWWIMNKGYVILTQEEYDEMFND